MDPYLSYALLPSRRLWPPGSGGGGEHRAEARPEEEAGSSPRPERKVAQRRFRAGEPPQSRVCTANTLLHFDCALPRMALVGGGVRGAKALAFLLSQNFDSDKPWEREIAT